jgi:hypothetical protein
MILKSAATLVAGAMAFFCRAFRAIMSAAAPPGADAIDAFID